MNTKETKKTDLTDSEKLDLILDKLDQLLASPSTKDEGPKDPGPVPPNP